VAGVAVRHYRGTADLALAARSAPSSGAASLRAAVGGFATADVPFDVYLDDQGRIRKLRQRFSFAGNHRDGAVAVYATTLLYGFGTPVSVTLPDEEDIYTGRIAEG
jgi:hypothetical protein